MHPENGGRRHPPQSSSSLLGALEPASVRIPPSSRASSMLCPKSVGVLHTPEAQCGVCCWEQSPRPGGQVTASDADSRHGFQIVKKNKKKEGVLLVVLGFF